jgi:hypothetical protein
LVAGQELGTVDGDDIRAIVCCLDVHDIGMLTNPSGIRTVDGSEPEEQAARRTAVSGGVKRLMSSALTKPSWSL